eukprot:1985103-Pleurochrysis_carterae.AAC.1
MKRKPSLPLFVARDSSMISRLKRMYPPAKQKRLTAGAVKITSRLCICLKTAHFFKAVVGARAQARREGAHPPAGPRARST